MDSIALSEARRTPNAVPAALLALAALLLTCLPAASQEATGAIAGRLFDEENHAVNSADVLIPELGLRGIVSTGGRFLVRDLPAGRHTLVVSLIGYERTEREVTVTAGQTTEINVAMVPRAIELRAIEVSVADRTREAQSRRVSQSEGAQQIGAEYIRAQQATTLADALRKTTSVQVDEEGGQQGSQVFVRGFTGDQVSIRVEGAPKNFNQVRHGGANTVWLEPDMYKGITVVPGVASNIYGNGSLGGVVMVETKDPEDVVPRGRRVGLNVRTGVESNGQSFYNAFDGGLRITDAFAISGTVVSRVSDPYEDGAGTQALLGATGSQDLNLLLKGAYDLGESQRVEVGYVGMTKEYESRAVTGSGEFRDAAATDLDEGTWSAEYSLNPRSNDLVNLSARFSRNETERNRLLEGDDQADAWGVTTNYFEVENVSAFRTGDEVVHQLRYGVDYTGDDVLTAYDDLLRTRRQAGFYLSETIAVGRTLSAVASVRYDRFQNAHPELGTIDESALSPKVHLALSPFQSGTLRGVSLFGVVGQGFRTPSVHEAYRDAGEPTCGRRGCSQTLPNPELEGETSRSWEAGMRFARRGVFAGDDEVTFQAGYNRSDVDGLITRTNIDLFEQDVDGDGVDDVVDVWSYTNVDEATIDGWEVSLNYAGPVGFLAVTAQTMDGVDAEGEKLPDISPHSLNATVGTYLFAGRSRVGVDMTSRAERIFTQRGVERRRQSYAIFDVFGSYTVNESLLVQLRVENMFDELYTKRTIVEDDLGNDVTTYAAGRNVKLTLSYRLGR
jgi:TonB-dependent heme/hemoglobin receptor